MTAAFPIRFAGAGGGEWGAVGLQPPQVGAPQLHCPSAWPPPQVASPGHTWLRVLGRVQLLIGTSRGLCRGCPAARQHVCACAHRDKHGTNASCLHVLQYTVYAVYRCIKICVCTHAHIFKNTFISYKWQEHGVMTYWYPYCACV